MAVNERFETLIQERVLEPSGFVSATFSGVRRHQTLQWQKITLRPVMLKGAWHLQIIYFDGRHDIRENVTQEAAEKALQDLLAMPFSHYFVRTTEDELHIRITKKGKALIKKQRTSTSLPNMNHDRRKHLPLPDHVHDPYLQASGIMNAQGQVLANKRSKFVQINKFLQLVEEMAELKRFEHTPLHILDCGCGSAYLTFAVHHYLNHKLQIPTVTVGVDISEKLLQRHQAIVEQMGWDNIHFEIGTIIEYEPTFQPDIVLALHACDTATDEALAKAIWSKSQLIFSVPCCHHHLQEQLENSVVISPFEPVLRHNILRERMGDILTDSFRAAILRILGYKTQVIEFVSSEHTARNLMIRAVYDGNVADKNHIREYIALKSMWNVTPYLETLLGDSFSALIE